MGPKLISKEWVEGRSGYYKAWVIHKNGETFHFIKYEDAVKELTK